MTVPEPIDAAIATLAINTIRTLSIDAVQRANSGHPGLPLGAAPMAYVLWQRHLRHDPTDPLWPDRDRFVLSAGHGSMLLYSLLHLAGYDVSLDDLKNFRQWESPTPGHPECFMTPGVEATTGPLGQGAANAVGMAMAERALANVFNRADHTIVDHYTYALVSDGDVMEGVACEAASLAGHLGLGKLIYLYDANDVTLDGPASLAFSEDVCARYAALGWHVLTVERGDVDLHAIDAAITCARAETERPSLIRVHTTIGYGSPSKAGKSASHGSPLGEGEVAATKRALGWDPEKFFHVPDEVRDHFGHAAALGVTAHERWRALFARWSVEHPDLANTWHHAVGGTLPEGWDADIPEFKAGDKPIATRVAGGKVLNAIAGVVPWLLGGDADLGGSTKTLITGAGDFDGRTGAGRNVRFGVREHAMGAIANGMDYHGGIRPFAATFFVFSDYMRPAVRLAALNGQPVVYVWTHDSVGLGEDGPTHQPIEHLMALRAMPNLHVIRPADAIETAEAWRAAMQRTDGPTALVLSRQDLPILSRDGAYTGGEDGVARGAYVLAEAPGGVSDAADAVDALIIATGSEVAVALAAREVLAGQAIACRVVSMPCWERFRAQPAPYREKVLPVAVTARVSVEAGVTFGWEAWLGTRGRAIGIDRFGASAPGEVNLAKLGITAERVADAVRALVGAPDDS